METPGSKKDFNKFVKKITNRLDRLNNIRLHKEFYGETTKGSFVSLTQLYYPKQYTYFK